MRELKLAQIWIYPIKSLGGISLSSAQVMGKGLQYDRRWMLVDEGAKFMTQRVHSSMALFNVTLDNTTITVHYKGDKILLPVSQPHLPDPLRVQIWDDFVTAFEVSRDYSEWFSERLGIRCRLVSFPESNARPVDPTYKVNDEHVSLADAFPYLVIGQASLDDLNTRLEQPVTINRFRPNFVFTGGVPYEEDTWREFTIGANRFVGVKPCARCVLTTVDPVTGEKGIEPLRTLSTYRRRESKVLFGRNAVALDSFTIYTGDIISLKISEQSPVSY